MENLNSHDQQHKQRGNNQNQPPPPQLDLHHVEPSPQSSLSLDLHTDERNPRSSPPLDLHPDVPNPRSSPPLDLHHIEPSPRSSPLVGFHLKETNHQSSPLSDSSSTSSDISGSHVLSPRDPDPPRRKERGKGYRNRKPESPPLNLHNDEKNLQSLPPSLSPPDSTSISSKISDGHFSSPHEPDPAPPAKANTVRAHAAINREVEEQKLGESRRRLRPDLSAYERSERQSLVYRALLGSRLCGFVACLVSFSLMAANKNQGWALDSFYNYKEFRYCLAVTLVGLLYSGYQMCDLAYQSALSKRRLTHKLRLYFDFAADQILAYLLASASSSAFVRVDEWEANWGSDKFPSMAKASAILSFLAFLAFGFSSLVSGYVLCCLGST